MQALLGTRLQFDHRFLWQTKAATLRQLREQGLTSDWQAARSCARKVYRRKDGAGVRPQCGVCSNCLLRRVSLLAAGLDSEAEREEYVWDDLAATTIAGSAHQRFEYISTRPSDEKIAISAVHLYQTVADASLLPDSHANLRQTAYEVARAQSIRQPEALQKLRALLNQNRSEWTSFLAMLPRGSWVVQRAGDA